MSKSDSTLTKTCSSCGIEKSLSAFLVLAGGSAHYGSICADCRKAGVNQKKPKEPRDEGTTSDTGHKIDTKARIAGEIDKRVEREEIEENYYKEREETEIEEKEEFEEEEETLKKEKEHHKSYLDSDPYLRARRGDHTKREPTHVEIEENVRETGNTHKEAEDKHNVETHKKEEVKKEEQHRKDEHTKEEVKKTKIDFTAPFEDTRIAGKIKYQSEMHKRFASWVGTWSPVGRTAQQEAAQKKGQENKEASPKEFVEKNWRPGSKR